MARVPAFLAAALAVLVALPAAPGLHQAVEARLGTDLAPHGVFALASGYPGAPLPQAALGDPLVSGATVRH